MTVFIVVDENGMFQALYSDREEADKAAGWLRGSVIEYKIQ